MFTKLEAKRLPISPRSPKRNWEGFGLIGLRAMHY
jgi:hypothetical protein